MKRTLLTPLTILAGLLYAMPVFASGDENTAKRSTTEYSFLIGPLPHGAGHMSKLLSGQTGDVMSSAMYQVSLGNWNTVDVAYDFVSKNAKPTNGHETEYGCPIGPRPLGPLPHGMEALTMRMLPGYTKLALSPAMYQVSLGNWNTVEVVFDADANSSFPGMRGGWSSFGGSYFVLGGRPEFPMPFGPRPVGPLPHGAGGVKF